MGLNWEKCNKQSRMWKNGFETISHSRPSKPKKNVKTVGDAVLELQHLKGRQRTKAVKDLLRNDRFRELLESEKTKKFKTQNSNPQKKLTRAQTAEEYEQTRQACLAYDGPPPWDE